MTMLTRRNRLSRVAWLLCSQWLIGLDECLRRLDEVIAAAKVDAGIDPDTPLLVAGCVA